jgi:hypothetical protein
MTTTEFLHRILTTALLAGGLALAAVGIAAGITQLNVSTVAFNPQPDPPGRPSFLDPGSRVGFNPQPDPPGSIRGFNPQPEPPVRIAVGR